MAVEGNSSYKTCRTSRINHILFERKNDYVKFLRDEKFILKRIYLALLEVILSKLNEFNLYLQGIGGDIFSVHDRI